MKTYQGIIKIECKKTRATCPSKIFKDVQPDCIDCEFSTVSVLDLEGKVLHTEVKGNGLYKHPNPRKDSAGRKE